MGSLGKGIRGKEPCRNRVKSKMIKEADFLKYIGKRCSRRRRLIIWKGDLIKKFKDFIFRNEAEFNYIFSHFSPSGCFISFISVDRICYFKSWS
jgi:hypothetical protein